MLIDGLPISGVGVGSLVILAILMIYTGRLVPKRHLDDARRDNAKLQETNAVLLEAVIEIKASLRDIVELARTTDHIVREIQGRREGPAREATSS